MASPRISAFRIVRPTWSATALSGEGARKYGGRWNPRGLPCVYLADSRALAALEILVHLTPKTRSAEYDLIEVSFPSRHVEALSAESLPTGWRRAELPEVTREFGRTWIESGTSPVLRVPSAIITAEHLYLLNPLHAAANTVRAAPPRPFTFDVRLH